MLQRYSDLTVFKMAAYNYSLDRSLSRVSKGPRANNNCHGPRLALIRHCFPVTKMYNVVTAWGRFQDLCIRPQALPITSYSKVSE